MKILVTAFFVFIIHNAAFIIQPVFAHVLKTDGNIGAVVHINPDDDPIVGQETSIYFDVKDKTGQYKSENCECIFVVKKAGVEVYQQPLINGAASYNFPEKNVYTMELRGSPKNAGQFQSFTLTYDVRVERENKTIVSTENTNSTTAFLQRHIPHAIVIFIVLIICSWLIYSEKRKREK